MLLCHCMLYGVWNSSSFPVSHDIVPIQIDSVWLHSLVHCLRLNVVIACWTAPLICASKIMVCACVLLQLVVVCSCNSWSWPPWTYPCLSSTIAPVSLFDSIWFIWLLGYNRGCFPFVRRCVRAVIVVSLVVSMWNKMWVQPMPRSQACDRHGSVWNHISL